MPLPAGIYAVLLALATSVLLGSSAAADAVGAADGPDDPAAPAAFFLVQSADLKGGRGIDLRDFSIVVCNAGLRPHEVRTAVRPDCLVLASLNCHQVPLWGKTNPVFQRLRAALDNDLYYFLDSTGTRASIYPNTQELRMLPEVADLLAEFAATEFRHWDGLFVDELWGERPDWALEALPGVTESDGPHLRAEWRAYRDRFLKTLRAGTDGVLIANVGREPEGVYHLDVSGISIESDFVHSAADSARFAAAFRPFPARHCIAWDWRVDPAAAVTGATWKDIRAGHNVFLDP